MPEYLSNLFSTELVKISPELIESFHNLGVALNCTRHLDPQKLDTFCQDIKARYYDEGLGEWYDMCSSVHKNIEHSAQYLERLQAQSRILTIGHLSETPLEVVIQSYRMITSD